jgi:hypothetical protein
LRPAVAGSDGILRTVQAEKQLPKQSDGAAQRRQAQHQQSVLTEQLFFNFVRFRQVTYLKLPLQKYYHESELRENITAAATAAAARL